MHSRGVAPDDTRADKLGWYRKAHGVISEDLDVTCGGGAGRASMPADNIAFFPQAMPRSDMVRIARCNFVDSVRDRLG